MVDVIDPTENVLNLVEAEGRHRDALREADGKFNAAQLAALERRLDDLSAMRERASEQRAEIVRQHVVDNAKLLANQIEKITATHSARLDTLEQWRYESSGRGSGTGAAVVWAMGAVTTVSTVISIVMALMK